MLRMKRQGFTLIELMVVIVIIGVLASLAIPRFTEASAKAKMAEAPRVLASYESAMLAAVAELPKAKLSALTPEELVFEIPTSNWFTYDFGSSTVEDAEGENITIAKAGSCKASAQAAMGTFKSTDWIQSEYKGAIEESGTSGEPGYQAAEKDRFAHTTSNVPAATKMIPNFGAVAEAGN